MNQKEIKDDFGMFYYIVDDANLKCNINNMSHLIYYVIIKLLQCVSKHVLTVLSPNIILKGFF